MIARLSDFRCDRRGIAVVEFAYAMPVLLVLGFMGAEVANLATTNMKLSQVTLTAADNASRLGEASTLSVRQLREQDINDVFEAARLQARGMELYRNGRMIISSVQKDASDFQHIAWQRCRGTKPGQTSAFGTQGTKASASNQPLDKISASGRSILASTDGAVILVETFYDYQPVADFSFSALGKRTLGSVAVFTVRDKRDLSRVYNPDPPATVRTCATLSS